MRTTALGPGVTAIGCGDFSLAVAANRGVDARDTERALHHALELGITLVDVHPGETDAERLAAITVRTLRARDRVVITTTVPHVPHKPGGAPRRDLLPELLPARYVQEAVESSLRATKLDALPLVQLPLRSAWRTSSAFAELAGTCTRLVQEGKALAWCARLDNVDDEALPFATDPWLAALSVIFNLCDRSAAKLLAASKLPVLARQPLAGGALADRLGPGRTQPPRDDRNAIPEEDLERIAITAARLAPELRNTPIAARSHESARAVLARGTRPDHVEANTIAELALRFVIDQGAIALPRLHRHETVMEAVVACASPPLTPGLLQRIVVEKS